MAYAGRARLSYLATLADRKPNAHPAIAVGFSSYRECWWARLRRGFVAAGTIALCHCGGSRHENDPSAASAGAGGGGSTGGTGGTSAGSGGTAAGGRSGAANGGTAGRLGDGGEAGGAGTAGLSGCVGAPALDCSSLGFPYAHACRGEYSIPEACVSIQATDTSDLLCCPEDAPVPCGASSCLASEICVHGRATDAVPACVQPPAGCGESVSCGCLADVCTVGASGSCLSVIGRHILCTG
jgi:hypothetical protein